MNNLKQYLVFVMTACLLISCGDDSSDVKKSNELKVSFQESSKSVVENSSNSIFIPLKLEGSSDKEVFVTYEVSGTADFPADVTPMTSTTFIIPAGATAYNMEMLIVEDAITELEPETLTIKFISVSEGASLGEQTSFDLNIEADDVTLISFEKESTDVNTGNDANVKVILSKAYSKDLWINISDDIEQGSNGEYIFDSPGQVYIPAGSTSAELTLQYNASFKESESPDVKGAKLKISGFRDEFYASPIDVLVNPDESKINHQVNVVGALVLELFWTSTNDDVDLDIFLTDSEGNVFLASEQAGVDGSETITIPGDFADGQYYLQVVWVEGTGGVEMILAIKPEAGATWVGSKDPDSAHYVEMVEAEISPALAILSVVKSGEAFDQ